MILRNGFYLFADVVATVAVFGSLGINPQRAELIIFRKK
jgi:hypothetical protein